MVHHTHDCVLVPPFGIFDAINLSSHNNDLASWNELASAIGGSEMLRNAGWGDFSSKGLAESVDKLVSLTRCKCSWRAGCKNKVTVQINDQSICGSSEESSALSSDTENIWTRFLDEFLDMSGMNHGHIETTPFIDTNAVADGLSSNCEHCWVV
jgi:hypothetical protein